MTGTDLYGPGAIAQLLETGTAAGGPVAEPAQGQPMSANGAGVSAGFWGLIGVVAIIAALKYLSEHEATALNPSDIAITSTNWLIITLITIASIVGVKIVFNLVHVPGLTELVNAA